MEFKYICFLFVITLSTVYGQYVDHRNRFETDQCYMDSNTIGVCTKAQICPKSRKMLQSKLRSHNLTRCEWNGFDEIVCCPPSGSVSPTDPKQIRKSEFECDKYSNEAFPIFKYTIRGGVNASEGDFPHMAALGFELNNKISYDCGGTLISDRYVLTAAHCLNRQDASVVVVKLGTVDIGDDSVGEFYGVEKTMMSPDYKPPKRYNDIGYVKLNRSVTFTPNIYPACLDTLGTQEVTSTASGWGLTRNHASEGSRFLQRVSLQTVNPSFCNDSYIERGETATRLPSGIIPSQICAGSSEKDTCTGDSGGPLQVTRSSVNIWVLVGITSFGVGCGDSKTPGVYTKVASHLDWIEKEVWS